VIQGLKSTGAYDYVLSYGAGSPVLAVNEGLNITDLVLAKLNEQAPVQ
jgi:Skp family chaperone for outer membrane proteins